MDAGVQLGQSRFSSLLESIVSVLIGFVLTMAVQFFMLPLFGIQIYWHEVTLISMLLVMVAFMKNYAVRRVFNAVQQRA